MKSSSFLQCVDIAAVMGLAACQGENNAKTEAKGGLSADLVRNGASAAPVAPGDLAKMPDLQFADSSHDFGRMKAGEKGTYEFQFTNKGGSPLLISSAEGSCGCTVPDYPREPIPPGGSGKLTVTFNSEGKKGHVEKSVSVLSNGKRGHNLLLVQADV